VAKRRKRRTKAEMEAAKEYENNSKEKTEEVENVEEKKKIFLKDDLPKPIKKEYVELKVPYPVIQEVRVLTNTQGTEKTIVEIVREELDKVKIWEFKTIPLSGFSVKNLDPLGKDGWKFVFDLSPDICPSVKENTLVFQRPKDE